MAMKRWEIVYPARGRQKFDGGLNSKFERSVINDNESPDCQDVVFSEGTVGTRGGSSQLNTTAVGSFVCDGLYTRHADTGAETMIGWWDGTAYTLGTTTFVTISSAQSVFTAGQRVAAAEYQNYIFFGDGGTTPYKYNGTDFTRHGVPQATGSFSVASATTAVGTLTAQPGDYQWQVAFVNSASVAGDVGTAVTLAVTLTSGRAALTSLPIAPQSHGVNARQIYRTVKSGTTFFLVDTLNDNTTTAYDDNKDDTELGVEADTDQGEPPNYSVICYHQNRLFCNDATNPSYLWYSDLEEPFTFGVTNFQKMADGSGDLIRGLDVYQNNLVVRCDNSVWIVYMPTTTVSDWRFIRISSAYGSNSPFGAFRYQDKFLFPATQNGKFVGFAALAGTSIDPSATVLENNVMGSELRSEMIEPQIFDVQAGYLANITSFVWKNKAYIAVTKDANSTQNNYVLLFDFSLGRLSKSQRELWSIFDGLNIAQFTSYGGKLYGGSSTGNGLVYEVDTNTYTDGSTAINSYYWTKEFSGLPGHENLIKDFTKVRLLVDKAGAYNMGVAIRVDSDSSDNPTEYDIDLDPGSTIWNAFTWGSATWGAGPDQEEAELSLQAVSGRRIQFRFSNKNTASQRFKVHGLNFVYNIRGTT